MKLIITEHQFERLKKGLDCPYVVRFEYVKKITNNHGRRFVCVDKEFYNLIQSYDFQNGLDINLKEAILEYYNKTYYWFPNEITIMFIHGGDNPSVGVKYQYKEN